MTVFQYDTRILTHYQSVVGGVILAQGMTNGPTPKDLETAFIDEQQATLKRLGDTPLSQIPSLVAWRSVFRSFGVDPTQYRSAAEALLRRLTKKGDIPGINLLVDLGNLVSIRYALPVAVFDTRYLEGAVTVHFADGAERYTTLGQDELEHPEPGEVVFSDDTQLVIARRWCWRQSDQSAAKQETTQAIITVEAHHEQGKEDIDAALDDLLGLLRTFTGGTFIFDRLDATKPLISDEET
ncbi:MAG TPA: phenylalanine--tRNA ligase beta subunit-related protein [Ktedonobacteraceae bacterium]|nr:phenylalanine--tRNA ligase beta subunit-related protein [Ktedonobacteraceae bacterium]